jgi:RHS repeat-associated protein
MFNKVTHNIHFWVSRDETPIFVFPLFSKSTFTEKVYLTENIEYSFKADISSSNCTGNFTVSLLDDNISMFEQRVVMGENTFTFTPSISNSFDFVFKHIGSNNCVFTIDNININHTTTEVEVVCDERGRYRYGFQNQEKDDEVKGKGNSYDFGARMLDARLGRWLSVDPLEFKYPSMTPYGFVGNNPIRAIDPNGKEIIITESINEETGKTKLKIELTGKVVFDFLSTIKTPEQKQNYIDNLNQELSAFFTKSFEKMEVEFVSKMTIGTKEQIEENDHVIYSMNLHTGPESKGLSPDVGGFVTGIGSKKAFFSFNINDYSTPIHEIGHWLGLYHPKDIAKSLSKFGIFDPATLEDKKYHCCPIKIKIDYFLAYTPMFMG